MAYTKRFDGRGFEEIRKMSAEVGIISRAKGSARFQIGDTIAIAAVHGPRELHPRFLRKPDKGVLRCDYDMVSFSVSERKRPGSSRRSMEISHVTGKSIEPVLDLSKYPNTVIDVFITIPQANAGTRCAGICAASLALADAGIPMKDLVVAISVGKAGDKVVMDLTKEEEDHAEGATDIPVAMTPRNGEYTLLQLDGDISKDELKEALVLAKKGCDEIYTLMQKTLRDSFKEKK
ncbi:exosome complex exonuclease Rrp41 [archaeon]|nr:exosome complex exonuclease Rrp41 [archaeon]